MSANFESGIFFRQEAWHRQGVVVQDIPDLDEAFHVAAMDWRVRKEPLFAEFQGERIQTDRFAIMRDKEGFERQILGVVGERYELFQNEDAFNWMRPLVDSKNWRIETAGVLCEGKKVWALLHQDEVEIVPNDVLKEYLLFTWGHDGMTPAIFQPTMIRVVCDNTLQASLACKNKVCIQHSRSMGSKLQFVQDLFTSTQDAFQTQIEVFQKLLDKKLTTNRIEELIEKLYGSKSDSKIAQTLSSQKVNFLKDFCLEKASGIKDLGIVNTGYGFFNALSEANEHYLLNSRSDVANNILFGSGFIKNQECLEVILAA